EPRVAGPHPRLEPRLPRAAEGRRFGAPAAAAIDRDLERLASAGGIARPPGARTHVAAAVAGHAHSQRPEPGLEPGVGAARKAAGPRPQAQRMPGGAVPRHVARRAPPETAFAPRPRLARVAEHEPPPPSRHAATEPEPSAAGRAFECGSSQRIAGPIADRAIQAVGPKQRVAA